MWKSRVTERRERERTSTCWFMAQNATRAQDWVELEPGVKSCLLMSLTDPKDPRNCCLARHISWELHLKLSSQDMNWRTDGG